MNRGLCSILVSLVICGCGGVDPEGSTGKVTGKVTYQGAPVSEGTVSFFCRQTNVTAGGKLQSDGSFTLLFAGGPKVPIGEYVVTVHPPNLDIEPGQPPPPHKEYPNIPHKYRSRQSTDLSFQIKETSQQAKFELTD